MLNIQSCLLAKWLRERVKVRARVRAGKRECSYSFFSLSLFFSGLTKQNNNIFVFVGLVASYEY